MNEPVLAEVKFDETDQAALPVPGLVPGRVLVSRRRLTRLAQQRYYTALIDNSFPLTSALLAARLLHQDSHGHYEPTKALDDLVASFDVAGR